MLCIDNDNTNPYFNMALEEYLLTRFQDEFFVLWRNSPCVVVGRNQNTLAEIDVDFVRENNIVVVRRLSGGGAVFHDLGNLNFTFIVRDEGNGFHDFARFTEPILEVLRKLGVAAELSGRNDLVIDGKKFSGNAQYLHRNRLLHHGTLLFASKITDLTRALQVKPVKFEDKSVKSVRSRVTNISDHLKQDLDVLGFKDLIMNHIRKNPVDYVMYRLSETDIRAIETLVRDKYSTWEWNFGRSPQYNYRNEGKFAGGLVEVCLNVRKGMIEEAKFYGDFFGRRDVRDIEQALAGTEHRPEEIRRVLSGFVVSEYFAGITLEDILSLF